MLLQADNSRPANEFEEWTRHSDKNAQAAVMYIEYEHKL